MLTEPEKRARIIETQNELLNGNQFFFCEKQNARITREQCARNYEKAIGFDEVKYLNNCGKGPHWGTHGKSGFVHPLIKTCQGCEVGKANSGKAEK
jgi:hypothetical protein